MSRVHVKQKSELESKCIELGLDKNTAKRMIICDLEDYILANSHKPKQFPKLNLHKAPGSRSKHRVPQNDFTQDVENNENTVLHDRKVELVEDEEEEQEEQEEAVQEHPEDHDDSDDGTELEAVEQKQPLKVRQVQKSIDIFSPQNFRHSLQEFNQKIDACLRNSTNSNYSIDDLIPASKLLLDYYTRINSLEQDVLPFAIEGACLGMRDFALFDMNLPGKYQKMYEKIAAQYREDTNKDEEEQQSNINDEGDEIVNKPKDFLVGKNAVYELFELEALFIKELGQTYKDRADFYTRYVRKQKMKAEKVKIWRMRQENLLKLKEVHDSKRIFIWQFTFKNRSHPVFSEAAQMFEKKYSRKAE